MSKDLFVAPVVSEKVYGLSTAHNRFAFIVPVSSNKHTVARAIEAQYGVEVLNVAIVNKLGKKVRTYRNKRFTTGSRNDVKKAYVTLKEGHSLPIFAAIEESAEDKPVKKATKTEDSKRSVNTTAKAPNKAGLAKRVLRQNKSGEK
ncbi:MAG: 50S ribosomal protein L23 [bacterium]|nr:50S ribosomal protein L23 [bacterium]